MGEGKTRPNVDEEIRVFATKGKGTLSSDMRAYFRQFGVNPETLSDEVKQMARDTESDDVGTRIRAYEEIGKSLSIKDNRLALLIRGLYDEDDGVKHAALDSIGETGAAHDFRVYGHLLAFRFGHLDEALEEKSGKVLDDTREFLSSAYTRLNDSKLPDIMRIDALDTIVISGGIAADKTAHEIVEHVIRSSPSQKMREFAIACRKTGEYQNKWLREFLPALCHEDGQAVRSQTAIKTMHAPKNGERKRIAT